MIYYLSSYKCNFQNLYQPAFLFGRGLNFNKKGFYFLKESVKSIMLLLEKFLIFDWPRAVVFQLNLIYLHVKITNLLREVVLTNNSMICT